MQNSQAFKSYVLDPSQVAGFKAMQRDLISDNEVTFNGNANPSDSWLSGYQLRDNEKSKILESKI